MNRKLTYSLLIISVQFRKSLINYKKNKLNCAIITKASDGLEFFNNPSRHYVDIILLNIDMDVVDEFKGCAFKNDIFKNLLIPIEYVLKGHLFFSAGLNVN